MKRLEPNEDLFPKKTSVPYSDVDDVVNSLRGIVKSGKSRSCGDYGSDFKIDDNGNYHPISRER